MVFHPLHQRVDGLEAEAVLLAPVEAVCLVDEKDAAQSALDDAVGQGGGVAGVAAHEVSPAHLHQLPALEGADGLEVLCHEPGKIVCIERLAVLRPAAARRCCT